jgi:tetratricopeptide (TPR) repeat protein
MALNYYVPTRMTSDEHAPTHAADAPADSAAPRAVADVQPTPADQLERLLLSHIPGTSVLCLPIARPADSIVGRGELLDELCERLLGAPAARLALDGPPGVGKTRLALEIAYDERIRRHFSGGVLMMGLGQHPDVGLHLRSWVAALGLEQDPRLSIAAQVERIAARIDTRGQPCLLIIDDVWKAEHCSFLPNSSFASVLITGRQRESSELATVLGEENLVAVPPLDQDAAIELLRERACRSAPDDIEELAALADLAGGSPLLLVLAGSYLHQQHQNHEDWFAQTLDDLDRAAQRAKLPAEPIEQTRLNLQEGIIARLRHRPVTQSVHPRIIVELSVAALPHDVREAFVKLAALPPDPLSFGMETAHAVAGADERIVRMLVRHALIEEVGDGRCRAHRTLADWASQFHHAEVDAAQQRLAAWHLDLIRAASADELAVWRQHTDNWQPLLQLWHRAVDDPDQLRASMQSVLPLLIDYGYWNDALAGLEHAINMHQHDRALAPLARYYAGLLHYRRADFAQAQAYTAEALEGFQAAQQVRSQVMALNLLGHIQKATGNYPAARDSYETARGLTPESDGRQYATCLTNLALLLQAQGDYTAARPLYNQALVICEQALDPTHPDIAASLANLASLLYDQGHYTAARPLCERALTIHEGALGPAHPHTAASLTSLARLLQAQGDYAAARPLYERALAIYEQALGPTHPDTATSLANMAVLLHDQGDYGGARRLYERALNIHEQVLGPDHPDTASSLANLASLLQDQGDYATARPLYERALAIHEQTPGPDHPDTASSQINLASLLKIQGDYATARPLYERALSIREQTLGQQHPHTAASLTSLARLLQAQGDYAAARPLYERALSIREQRLGPEHPGTADSLGNLAGLLREQGDLAAARVLYERALAIHEQMLGAEHPSVAGSLTNLAHVLQSQGDVAAARPLYERALNIREQALGAQHPDTATSLNNLALLLQAAGDYTAARALYKRVLDTRMRIFGKQHPQTAASVANLASLLQAQGDYANAQTLYEHALEIYEHALGPQHPDTATSLNNLALLHKAQGELVAARPLYERALNIRIQALGPQHLDTATSLNNLASLLYELGDLESARPLCERALAIRARALGSQHPHTIASMTNLALLYHDAGQLTDAAHLLRRALTLREAVQGPEHAGVQRLRQLIAQIERHLKP